MKNKRPQKTKAFVTAATSLKGIIVDDDIPMLKNTRGLVSGIRVRGIDIHALKPDDKERTYAGWGAAEQGCELPHKIVLCKEQPNFSPQKEYLTNRAAQATHPHSKYILERHIYWIDAYQEKQKDRAGYVLFFGKEKDALIECTYQYVQRLSEAGLSATICSWADMLRVCQTLLSTTNIEENELRSDASEKQS